MDNVDSHAQRADGGKKRREGVGGARRKKRPVGSSVAFSSIHDITPTA